ncbi:hypothetical protein ENSA5_38220 [Enhygromyxa salina]|uniref:Uncharacterized protein n=1 Tax=Enhygromyxa salina TaxID=215803 RepID=A0A2S9XRP9_9BACT|nr:hypothetical protein [Enhygromyxa salina]PRP95539.1 hypothetical protein ENSA5_38220 [Enhygromyxa salina]
MHRLPFALGLSALILTGCPAADDTAETADPETSTGDGDGDTGDTGDTEEGDGDGDPGDGDGDTGSCGDGELDDGEECDDGNNDDGDGCSSTCQVSECGLAWAVSMDVPSSTAGAFEVAMGDDGSIFAAGVAVNADNDAWAAKWNADGTLAWQQSYDSGNGNDAATGIALGAGGEIYLAGWMEGAGDDLWYAQIDPSSGAEIWAVTVAGDLMIMDGDDLGTGIAVDPSGDLIVAGRLRVGDGDDDIWVRKASAADGAEIWTSTWTGVGDGMFSTDRAGPVTVADDGTIWVAAREHVDFNTQEATALKFDGDGNFVSMIQPQAGGDHQHDVIDIVADGGSVYFAMQKNDFPYRGWLYKFGSDGSEEWVKTEEDWIIGGEDWAVRGIGIDGAGHVGVGGVFSNEDPDEGIDWGEAWVARLDGAGEFVCRSSHMIDDGMLIPPSLSVDAAGFNASGFGVVGIETAGQGNATKLWTGFFKP